MVQQIEAPPASEAVTESRLETFSAEDRAVQHLADIPLTVEVLLGTLTMNLRSIAALQAGSVLVLDRAAGENVDLYVNGVQLASVEIVPLEDVPGLRITDFIFGE
jgi:flagellar motor switch protein FliN/FliY